MASLLSDMVPVSILYKSIAGRYRPVRVADGPITARYRFIKNASWGVYDLSLGVTGRILSLIVTNRGHLLSNFYRL